MGKKSALLNEAKYEKFQKELKKLAKQKKQLLDDMQAIDERQNELLRLVEKLEKNYDDAIAAGNNADQSQAKLMEATKQMQETQMSFNLQYLQLQSQMQHENRSYTAVSNIMKTKHDTVKNSISNVR